MVMHLIMSSMLRFVDDSNLIASKIFKVNRIFVDIVK